MMKNFLHIGKSINLTTNHIHTHNSWEIVLYLKGKGTVFVAGKEIPFRTGTLFLLPPFIEHTEWSKGTYSSISLRCLRMPGFKLRFVFVQDAMHEPLRNLMEMMHEEYHQEELESNLCDEMLALTAAHIKRLENAGVVSDGDIIKKMKHLLINEIPNTSFKLSKELATFQFSPAYLSKMFRRSAGVSPMQFLINLRMESSCKLLVDSTLSIKEVSRQVGYEDQCYFSRLFSIKMKMSPKEYRQTAT